MFLSNNLCLFDCMTAGWRCLRLRPVGSGRHFRSVKFDVLIFCFLEALDSEVHILLIYPGHRESSSDVFPQANKSWKVKD